MCRQSQGMQAGQRHAGRGSRPLYCWMDGELETGLTVELRNVVHHGEVDDKQDSCDKEPCHIGSHHRHLLFVLATMPVLNPPLLRHLPQLPNQLPTSAPTNSRPPWKKADGSRLKASKEATIEKTASLKSWKRPLSQPSCTRGSVRESSACATVLVAQTGGNSACIDWQPPLIGLPCQLSPEVRCQPAVAAEARESSSPYQSLHARRL